jgi:3-methylcrotonyl-CoA carboxylase alpha subunit
MPKKGSPIQRLLIANRGEIACRIIRTCRRLGIATIAVYSEADARSLHTHLADERVPIGAAETSASYLNGKAIIAAARKMKADAIHPGYGFLSENADFAEAVRDAKLIFVGPAPETIRTVGNKVEAKKLADRAGIPLIPGFELPERLHKQKLQQLLRAIGLPAVVKAAGGGGGRGMRRLFSADEAEEKIAAARAEAQKFFASPEVFIERLVEPARHVEVQIVGDRHGEVAHIFDRDCSMQRHYQKVIEEAPAPGLSSKVQERVRSAAVKLAKAAAYENAGTIEFLIDGEENFYFLEVNARLQVEHPVTEAVTGLDLVELQLRIAEGRALSEILPEPRLHGHAVECRICAEDPAHGFAASTGELACFAVPEDALPQISVRIDSGFKEGDCITHYYDSLLAKLVVSGPSRKGVLEAADDVLAHSVICGISTNTGFLRALLQSPALHAARHHTQLAAELVPAPESDDARRAAAAACYLVWRLLPPELPAQPWSSRSGWRMHGESPLRREFESDGRNFAVSVERRGDTWMLEAQGSRAALAVAVRNENGFEGTLDGSPIIFRACCTDIGLFAAVNGVSYRLAESMGRHIGKDRAAAHGEELRAPLPGKIIALSVKPGGSVRRGDALVTLESMKMEHIVRAPHDGAVETIKVAVGDIISAHAVLLELKA